MSLWDDPTFKSAYNSLSKEDKLKYQQIGEEMYNTINFQDPKVDEYNYAANIKLMLRDGLALDDLTLEEKKIYVEAYGVESLLQYQNEDKQKPRVRRARKVGKRRV